MPKKDRAAAILIPPLPGRVLINNGGPDVRFRGMTGHRKACVESVENDPGADLKLISPVTVASGDFIALEPSSPILREIDTVEVAPLMCSFGR